MTKFREPLTSHRAVFTIAELLGYEEAARVADRQERTVRAWSDPDQGTGITLHAALMLDYAYRHAGGEIAPLLSWYQARLDSVTAGLTVSLPGRMQRSAVAAIEAGEAVAAQFLAYAPNAGNAARATARRETQEAIAALHHTLCDFAADGNGGATHA